MNQLYLFTEFAARHTDPPTSHAAAKSVIDVAQDHHALILRCLRDNGRLGKDGIASRTRLDGVQTCRRLTELHRLGLIEPTGEAVMSTAGRREREWRLIGAP